MIEGIVSEQGIPFVEVEISGRRLVAVIDSGFNGDLELPASLQADLPHRFVGRVSSLLAAGQVIEENVYLVDFPFDGQVLVAEATFVASDEILIGTHVLMRHRLIIDFPRKMVLLDRADSAGGRA